AHVYDHAQARGRPLVRVRGDGEIRAAVRRPERGRARGQAGVDRHAHGRRRWPELLGFVQDGLAWGSQPGRPRLRQAVARRGFPSASLRRDDRRRLPGRFAFGLEKCTMSVFADVVPIKEGAPATDAEGAATRCSLPLTNVKCGDGCRDAMGFAGGYGAYGPGLSPLNPAP